eukprot:SAG31_NODE_6001_length_2219_cov_1.753774_1_plen_97_part_00
MGLPAGWSIEVSRTTGRHYYFNSESGESTYEFPGTSPVSAANSAAKNDGLEQERLLDETLGRMTEQEWAEVERMESSWPASQQKRTLMSWDSGAQL